MRIVFLKFLNKIDKSDSMYLRIKEVKTLEEAYYSLVETSTFRNRKYNNKNAYSNDRSYQNKKFKFNKCTQSKPR